MAKPRCPITGEPAQDLVQTVPVSTLRLLWRRYAGVDVAPLLAGHERIGLWRSPCGLAFFDPAIAGDDRFYRDFYARFRIHEMQTRIAAERPEYLAAASHVAPGDEVLDVGAGSVGFGLHLGHARYTGLDPYADEAEVARGIVRQSVEDHAASHAGRYDVVSAFQVIEHTADPLAFARSLAAMLRPGGRLILGAPVWPSPLTEVPNMVINCPPHHLTWWTEDAMRALAARLGLDVVATRTVAPHRNHARVHWLEKMTLVDKRGRHFANKASWHLNLALAYPVAVALERLAGLPRDAAPIDVMLVARRP